MGFEATGDAEICNDARGVSTHRPEVFQVDFRRLFGARGLLLLLLATTQG